MCAGETVRMARLPSVGGKSVGTVCRRHVLVLPFTLLLLLLLLTQLLLILRGP